MRSRSPASLHAPAGTEVLGVCAFPYDDRPSAHFNPVMRAPLHHAAWAILERLTEPLSDLPRVRRLPVADPSPARALLGAVADAGAQLIVVGSSHAGYHARPLPGSTAARLLHGAPVAVALAPQGHRLRPQSPRPSTAHRARTPRCYGGPDRARVRHGLARDPRIPARMGGTA
jgi:nucleotide-binding universal stress UspA family protein